MAQNRAKKTKAATTSKTKKTQPIKKERPPFFPVFPDWFGPTEKAIYTAGFKAGYDAAKQEESEHD